MTELTVETIHLDLPTFVGAFSQRLHRAGVPMTAERASNLAQALALVNRSRGGVCTGPRVP